MSRLDCFEVELPVRAPLYTMSQGRALTAFTTIVVRVEAEDGTAGCGESCTLGTNRPSMSRSGTWGGKLLGQPAAVLLGGVLQRDYPTFHALTLDAPERMAAETTRMRGEGYRCWQLKLSSAPAADADRLRAVLEAAGDASDFMTSDPSGAWTVAQASEFLQYTGGLKTFVEQTCSTASRSRPPMP